MTHINQQIREEAKTQIEAAGLRSVSTNRGDDVLPSELPHIALATDRDEVELDTMSGLEVRTVTLIATIVADGEVVTLDDDLDELRVTIENALRPTLGPFGQGIRHTGAELIMGSDEEGDRWFAFYILSFEVTVHTTGPETKA